MLDVRSPLSPSGRVAHQIDCFEKSACLRNRSADFTVLTLGNHHTETLRPAAAVCQRPGTLREQQLAAQVDRLQAQLSVAEARCAAVAAQLEQIKPGLAAIGRYTQQQGLHNQQAERTQQQWMHAVIDLQAQQDIQQERRQNKAGCAAGCSIL